MAGRCVMTEPTLIHGLTTAARFGGFEQQPFRRASTQQILVAEARRRSTAQDRAA